MTLKMAHLKHLTSTSLFIVFMFISSTLQTREEMVQFSMKEISLLVDETELFRVNVIGNLSENAKLSFQMEHRLVQLVPDTVDITPQTRDYDVCMLGLSPGNVDVVGNLTSADGSVVIDDESLFIKVTVMISRAIYHISFTMGWIYFVAWSISFYPQIYENYKRKSVVGLNFDFLALNLLGFIMYSLFNVGLYFIPEVENEYFRRHPRGLNPVQINDIFFAIHAVFATGVTIFQCTYYPRDNQTVSYTARGILAFFGVVLVVTLILAGTSVVMWLDFLYYCSYIKLAITLIKYIPQAYMNYTRKSTEGWSIGNIFLDFTGGILSMLQMILNAYNYNDWVSIFGDPTKFGLGLFSVVFDIFFILQHYVFYRNQSPYMEVPGANEREPENRDTSEQRNENTQHFVPAATESTLIR